MTAHGPHSVPCVLVIDDDRVIRMVVREALEAAGMRVLESADPEEGLALAHDHDPDLVILDIMLPRMDGLAVLGQLRERAVRARVLVFSATGSRNAELARELGADAYLTKPFELAELVDACRELLAGRSAA